MQPSLVAPLPLTLSDMGPLPVRRGGAATAHAWTSDPERVLLIVGWDREEEGSGGHWVGFTHDGTVRCLSRGDKSLAAPRDPHAATGGVLASIPRVYAVWYAVLPTPGLLQLPPYSTSTPARGTRPARRRGGCASGCKSRLMRLDPVVRAPGGRPLRLP